MKYFLSAILTFCVTLSLAQSGNFLLSHYSRNKDRMDNVCFQIAQSENGLMYFATRGGLVTFDGRSWDLVAGSGAIYTIQMPGNGTIYWGGANGFGEVMSNGDGLPEMKTLSVNAKEIFQSVVLKDNVYFLNDEHLFILDCKTKNVQTLSAPSSTGNLTGVFILLNSIYITTARGKTLVVHDDKLQDKELTFIKDAQIVFSTSFNQRDLIGLSSNEIMIADHRRTFRKVVLKDQRYLNESIVVSGSWVNDNLIALGTLRGGLVFLNLSDGTTREIVNYSTGLPDNEIFCIATDRTQSVWAAHEYGFTRMAPHLPFRSFSYYPGLSGNLLCALSFANSVYVGTSLGLYKLEKEEVYEERKSSEDTGRNVLPGRTSQSEGSAAAPDASKRKGFFHFLRKKESPAKPSELAPPIEKDDRKTRQKKQTLEPHRILITTTFRYKKVKNINAKVTQLLEFNGKLLACGLEGTFQINNTTAQKLVDHPTRYVYVSQENVLFAATYDDEVKTLSWNASKWGDVDLLQNFNDRINHIFEGPNGEIWLCALDKIYRLELQDYSVKSLKTFEIENPGYDEFVGVHLQENCVVANANGFYHYQPAKNSFIKVDSLSTQGMSGYFSRNESIWYRDRHGWSQFGNNAEYDNMRLLNLFSNVRFITSDNKTDNLWVITDNNQLYKYFTDRISLTQDRFPLVLKSIKNADKDFGGRRALDIDQDNSRLTFEVVQPDYLAADAIEYRYHLTGLDEDWAEWSPANNVIEIPYLPSGEYSLEVEARDIFGRQSALEKISLNVLPPYWKRPWFYAVEVLFFSFLVILSFRLSTRYRIISRLLMLLTIIMLIQFIETIIGQTLATTTSPVIDFLIQVVIAMMVLPVEGYLRELMLRSLDTSNRFYRFIAPKALVSQEPKEDFE